MTIPADPYAPRSVPATGWTQVVHDGRCFMVKTLDADEAIRIVKEMVDERP